VAVAARLQFRLNVAVKPHFDQYLPLNDMNRKALQVGALGLPALSIRSFEFPSVRRPG
jgi:hypothetical protein